MFILFLLLISSGFSQSTGFYNSLVVGDSRVDILPSSLLELSSTTRGFLPPVMTTTQRDAIASPAFGLQVDNSTTNQLERFNGTSWEGLGEGITQWVTAKNYNTGNIVYKNRDLYLCNSQVDSTTNPTFENQVSVGNWILLSPTDNSTGLLTGGEASIGPGANQVTVNSGVGTLVDPYTSDSERTFKVVSFNGATLTSTIPANSNFYVVVDENAAPPVPIILTGNPSLTTLKNQIMLSTGLTGAGGAIIQLAPQAWKSNLLTSDVQNFMVSFGNVKESGGSINPISNTMQMTKTSGVIHSIGTNPTAPRASNLIDFPAQNPMTFYYATTTVLDTGGQTNIYNPNVYEPDGLGTTAGVPAGQYTIQRFYLFTTGQIFIQYGQTLYSSMEQAVSNVLSEKFVVNSVLSDEQNFIFTTYGIVQQGTTNLDAGPTVVRIVNCGKLGCGGISTSVASPVNGDFFGPATSNDNAIVRFDGNTGKMGQNSGVLIDDTNNMSGTVNFTSTGNMTVDTPTFFVDSVNNEVGIGRATADLYAPLDVVGDIYVTMHGGVNLHDATEVGSRNIGMKSGNTGDGFTGMQTRVSATTSDGVALANSSTIGFFTWINTISINREVMRITERGRVGINTTNPSHLLSVNGTALIGGGSNTTNVGAAKLSVVGTVSSVNGPHITFNDDGDIYPQRQLLNWAHDDQYDCFDCYWDGSSWKSSSNSSVFRWHKVANSFNLEGTAAPVKGNTIGFNTFYSLNENGNSWFSNDISAISFTTRSDVNLKKNIKDLILPDDFLDKIRPVSYEMKNPQGEKTKTIGLIAQELQKILPTAVHKDSQGMLGVEYSQVTAALIKIIKMQEERIDKLEKKINCK